MATIIPVSTPTRDGSLACNIAVSDTIAGNAFVNNGKTYLILDNKQAAVGSAPITVTVLCPGKVDLNLQLPNRTYTVNAGDVKIVGPYDMGFYNQPDGTVIVETTAPLGLLVVSDIG